VVVGIFHPETPRFLFYARDKKSDCVNSLQWLRGKRADIGMEYADMADAPNIIRRSEIRSQVQLFLQRSVNKGFIEILVRYLPGLPGVTVTTVYKRLPRVTRGYSGYFTDFVPIIPGKSFSP